MKSFKFAGIQTEGRSPRSYIVTLLLCLFLGWLGFHRFYTGKIWTGLLQLITFGFWGIWTVIDFLIIVVGQFRDKEGKYIQP